MSDAHARPGDAHDGHDGDAASVRAPPFAHEEEPSGGGEDEQHEPGLAASPARAAQAYRAPFNETVAPPNAPLARVVRAPVDFPPESKRAQLIEDAEVDLEQDMDELEAAVHAYNVDFQRRIDDVKARGRSLEDAVRGEYEAMEESMNQLQHAFRRGFETAFVALERQTLSHFARVEAHEVAREERSIREGGADARLLFYTAVPAIMEALQGSITRKLEKNHEAFDIENAKTQKRERKTAALMESNERRTESHFRTERERRRAKFREREEDGHHVMRIDNRASEAQQCDCVETLGSLQTQLGEERRVRQKEDLEILDKLGVSFHRLQSSILENLGEAE